MSSIVTSTVYFEKPGPENTEETIRLAKVRADSLGIRNIAIASSTGKAGLLASEVFKGYNLVIITHVTGFSEPNVQRFQPENRERILGNGAKILTAAHAFGGLGRAVNRSFNTIQVDEIIANVLRLFGQGTKVAVECVLMAADAGLLDMSQEVMSIAGTEYGADTALVLKPVYSHEFFALGVREIVAKPR